MVLMCPFEEDMSRDIMKEREKKASASITESVTLVPIIWKIFRTKCIS